MTDDKWEQLVGNARKNFKNVELTTEDLIAATSQGQRKQGKQDILIFESPAGRFKVVRESRPVVLEKKQFYSHRAGDTARTEYTFSPDQFTYKLKVFKEAGFDEWEEIALDRLGL